MAVNHYLGLQERKQPEQAIANGGYQYVKSGGFGISLVQEVVNAMNERGTKGKVVSDPLTGLAYLKLKYYLMASLIRLQLDG